MERITSDNFDNWANSAIASKQDEIHELFVKYGVANEPTPETIMLAAVHHGTPFMEDMGKIYPVPGATANATGAADTAKTVGWFSNALGAAQGVTSAISIFGKTPQVTPEDKTGQGASQKKDPENPSNDFSIFGLEIHKTYVYLFGGLVLAGIAYVIWRKNRG